MHPNTRRAALRALCTTIVVATAACGGSGGYASGPKGDPGPVQSASVDATPQIQFSPSRVKLLKGGTVTFKFGTLAHNVYFDNAPAGAPDNITGTRTSESVTLTFGTSGTFTYNCHIHPGMSGTVEVQ